MASTLSGVLPPWVYDLIGAVERYEDEHAKGGDCLDGALSRVPAVERDRAAAIRAYCGAESMCVVELPADASDDDMARFITEWERTAGTPLEVRRARRAPCSAG